MQIGREISWKPTTHGFPPPFQKLQYLTIIASGLKKGENLVDIVEALESEFEGESVSDVGVPPSLANNGGAIGENGAPDAPSSTGNANADAEPDNPTNKPKASTEHPTIRGGEVFLCKPLRLSSRKGSVVVTITRVEVMINCPADPRVD